MSTNTDNRNDHEYIKSLFDSDGIHAPDSLSEDSILAMLPDREDTEAPKQSVHEPSGSRPSQARTPAGEDFTPVRARKKPAVRKWIAAAACVMIALFGTVQIYEAVTAPPNTVTETGELYTFKDQSEIKHLVSSLDKESDMYLLDGGDSIVLEESATEDSAAPATGSQSRDTTGLVSSEAKSASSGADHSDTYLQVEEVDEADIVKTDGKYIYYVNRDREVVILSADEGKTKQLAKIGSADVENYIHDIFLKGDILVTVGKVYENDEGYTGIATYDISDRSDPELISVFRQTGDIVSSRMVGNYVYLVTSDRVYKDGRVVPKVMTGDKAAELEASDICCVPEPKQPSYIVLSAADISSGKDAKCKTTAVFGATDDIYCNDHNLYCAVSEWPESYDGEEYTRIVRASLDGLKVKFNATAGVRGHIDDQFSMDEHDGYFRIATTSWRDNMEVNNLYVLDSKLKESGSVSGFARNESIRAVRYFGDKAYVITYEQIDPLFIIDLSDPERPKIEGEVKIDGFSTLLIPAGEGRLLGIGHATGDNGYGGEYASGLKLVLFDISDPSEPKVMDSKEFKDMTSPAQDTHKALTVNSAEGWYAVPYGIYHYDEQEVIEEDNIAEEAETAETEPPEALIEDTYTDPHYEAGVLVFGADDELSIYDQHRIGSSYLPRSVYIGDYIYALDEEGNVSSFHFAK